MEQLLNNSLKISVAYRFLYINHTAHVVRYGSYLLWWFVMQSRLVFQELKGCAVKRFPGKPQLS